MTYRLVSLQTKSNFHNDMHLNSDRLSGPLTLKAIKDSSIHCRKTALIHTDVSIVLAALRYCVRHIIATVGQLAICLLSHTSGIFFL